MLKQFSKGPVSALSDVWPTIGYLQNLRGEHIDLILEYSKWVIKVTTTSFVLTNFVKDDSFVNTHSTGLSYKERTQRVSR